MKIKLLRTCSLPLGKFAPVQERGGVGSDCGLGIGHILILSSFSQLQGCGNSLLQGCGHSLLQGCGNSLLQGRGNSLLQGCGNLATIWSWLGEIDRLPHRRDAMSPRLLPGCNGVARLQAGVARLQLVLPTIIMSTNS